jgi:hypothetical protein
MSKTVKEIRAAKAAYMREYTRKNRERLKAQRAERTANLDPEEAERRRELGRVRNRRYHEKNKDAVNARAKARNWNYDPVTAKTKRQKYYERFPARSVLATVQKRADKKGLGFDLTEEWYDAEFEKGCPVTGIAFARPRSSGPWTAHVDKVNPDLGYTQSNCRLVCAMYNQAKGRWTDEDVLDMAYCLVGADIDGRT